MTVVINHESYGDPSTFADLGKALDAIRQCGSEFENTTLTANLDMSITDERGRKIGYITSDEEDMRARAELIQLIHAIKAAVERGDRDRFDELILDAECHIEHSPLCMSSEHVWHAFFRSASAEAVTHKQATIRMLDGMAVTASKWTAT